MKKKKMKKKGCDLPTTFPGGCTHGMALLNKHDVRGTKLCGDGGHMAFPAC